MNADNSFANLLVAMFAAYVVAIAVSNLWTLVRYFARGTRGSMLPLLSGIQGCLAIEFCPYDLHRWWWVPLLVDPGSAFLAVGGVVFTAWRPVRRRE